MNSLKLELITLLKRPSRILTITVGANAHTTGWTDVSKDVPDGIIKIVNGIMRIVSKKKIV
ncbi:MAG: hypothetical protein WAK17_23870 [Candidatus Nitrosopolaris sp.]|jgi:hypothetical protein